MKVVRAASVALSLNRTVFGMAYASKPASAGAGWVGRASRDPATQVFIRGHGARDVALGAGTLISLARRDYRAAQIWSAAQALADGSDLVATLAAGSRLPRRGFRFALAMAGASTAIAAIATVALGRST